MVDKLENIKETYEIELDQRGLQLENSRNMAMNQLKAMQQSMRQEQVNNQKEILTLKEELKIKQKA